MFFFSIEINYVLSADSGVMPSRVRLTEEVGPTFTGEINGTLTLMRDQQICVNITAAVKVNLIIAMLICEISLCMTKVYIPVYFTFGSCPIMHRKECMIHHLK